MNAASKSSNDAGLATMPPVLHLFGTHNEDARVELALVDLIAKRRPSSEGLRVLCVAGCGTHTIALAGSPAVQSIDAVDIRSTQIMLAALTVAGTAALDSPDDLAVLLGTGGNIASRRALYRDTVRSVMPHDVAEYWDANAATLEAGAARCGGQERIYAEIRARQCTAEWQASIENIVSSAYTTSIVMKHMPGMPAKAIESFIPKLMERTAKGIKKHIAMIEGAGDGTLNQFAHLTLTGDYLMSPVDARPLFLQQSTFAAAKALGIGPKRLRFHVGRVEDVAPRLVDTNGGGFDVISISNILSLHDHAVAEKIARCLKPGGALLCRWTHGREVGSLDALFRKVGLVVVDAINARMLEYESSYVMTDVCVGFAA